MLSERNISAAVSVKRTDVFRCFPILLIAFCVGMEGCASTGRYTSANLPSEWHALPTANVRTIGLTKLAGDSVPVDQITGGDVIEINLVAGLGTNDSAEFQARVNEQGFATIPHVGQVYLGGLTLEAAESAIKTACIQGEFYRDPHVVVTMKQRKTVQVTVVGAVEKEGTYSLRSGAAGLLSAISTAGGFTEKAGTTVELRTPATKSSPGGLIAQAGGEFDGRLQNAGPDGIMQVGNRVPVVTSGPTTVKIDLASLGEDGRANMDLPDGAVVMVERQDPLPITVDGLVKKPDTYDFPIGKNMRLTHAISEAGGKSSLVADKVFVSRKREGVQEPILIELSYKNALRGGPDDILLEPGDTVSVQQTPGTVLLETIRLIGFTIGGSVF